MQEYILFLDSGVGGVSIFKKAISNLPQHNYIYFADNKFAPYGNKSKRALRQHLYKLIKKLTSIYSIKIVVLACNTATVSCIDYLRKKFDMIFVGCEPNIKSAIKYTKNKVLVLATDLTIKQSKVLQKYNFSNVILSNQKELAKLIDDNIGDIEKIKRQVYFYVQKYLNKNIDAVVLGCTHYVFIKYILQDIFVGAKFFDSSQGVVNRLKFMIRVSNVKPSQNPTQIVINSKDDMSFNQQIKNLVKSL